MQLSSEQKGQLKLWLDEGMSLTEIYRKVSDEWKLPMTYMELRFLIDDLDLAFPESSIPEKEDEMKSSEEAPQEPQLMHGVSVSVDKVIRPGMLANGSVTFSDGVTAVWQLDQMGRIGLIPSQEGYKPSPEDVQEFQIALQDAMP